MWSPATRSDGTPRSSPRGYFRLFSPFKGSNSVSKSCLATSLLLYPIAQQPFRNAVVEALGDEPDRLGSHRASPTAAPAQPPAHRSVSTIVSRPGTAPCRHWWEIDLRSIIDPKGAVLIAQDACSLCLGSLVPGSSVPRGLL